MQVYFECHGCSMNYGESRLMKELVEKEFSITNNFNNADVIVLSTCTVIERTERKMLKRIKFFSEKNKKIIVSGCMAVVQKEKIFRINKNAKLLKPREINKIGYILKNFEKETEKQVEVEKTNEEKITNAIIPIAQGCLGKCSYCITRIARGKLKSYSLQEILKDIERKLSNNFKEIRLTALDTSCYGKDIKTNLPKLINDICKLNYNFRIRVGMMNPKNVLKILDELINSYKNEKVFKFLHLPIQSGDDDILKLMQRGYKTDDFKKIVKKFRENFDDLTLSTDIIVGFPSETEKQFENTLNLIKEIKPDIINIKGFSPREKTKASSLPKIHSKTIRERTRVLSPLRFEISKGNFEKLVGREENVLIAEEGKNNTFIGRTNSYRPVILKDEVSIGKFYDVKIESAKNFYLIGSLIK